MTATPRVWVGALAFAAALGCGRSDSSTPDASASGAPAPSTVAPAPVAASGAAHALKVEAAMVVEDERLGRLLATATPACVSTERYFLSDGHVVHAYDVYAPAIAQADLERAFADEAKRLGFTLTERPRAGRGVFLEEERRSAILGDARVSVLVPARNDHASAVRELAEGAKLDTWSLVEAFGSAAKWDEVAIERSLQGGVTVTFSLSNVTDATSRIEAWAKPLGLIADDGAWVRRFDPKAPAPSAILVSVEKNGGVRTMEMRGAGPDGSGCRAHASRSAEPADAPAPSAESQRETDALIEEMMK